MASRVSGYLRENKQQLADRWERTVREKLGAELQSLDRSALVDHLPEVLDGLAAWIDGDEAHARTAFEILAEGHAMQRLGFHVSIETLTREYAILRATLMRALLELPGAEPEALLRLHEGLDEAVYDGVHRYSRARDQTRDRFVAILAHDLRNPLDTISLGAARILTSGVGGDDKLLRTASMIVRSAERMARMIKDVIEFARGQLGGGMPTTLVSTDLGLLCEEAVQELAAAHPHRDLKLQRHGDLRGYWDRDRVLQAMSNLIGNAVQHGRDPIVVEVREDEDRRSITTRVRNRGRKLTEEELRGLFDPFRPGGSSKGGLGLGLYIVQKVALAHAAMCSARSSDEETVIEIRWPRAPLEETPDRQ